MKLRHFCLKKFYGISVKFCGFLGYGCQVSNMFSGCLFPGSLRNKVSYKTERKSKIYSPKRYTGGGLEQDIYSFGKAWQKSEGYRHRKATSKLLDKHKLYKKWLPGKRVLVDLSLLSYGVEQGKPKK